MSDLFVSSGYLEPQDIELVNVPGFDSLPPFLRVLLSTDGTVTKSLESFFWEPVGVETLEQGWQELESPVPDLNRMSGDKVWQRSVRLLGGRSGVEYATALSLICVERLSGDIGEALEAGKVGIGELLRECGLETYRQIMRFGANKNESGELESVWRSYRIMMDQKPFIQITETFPLSVYR